MTLLVQVKLAVVVVGVPETTGFPGADGATAIIKMISCKLIKIN